MQRRWWSLALLCFVQLYGAAAKSKIKWKRDEPPPDSLKIEDEAAFEKAIAAHDKIFVKFYAPWCQHCSAMASDWERVAAKHGRACDAPQDDGKPCRLQLAEVQCDLADTRALCKRIAPEGYPHLVLFQKQVPVFYPHDRTEKAMTKWVDGWINPPASCVAWRGANRCDSWDDLAGGYNGTQDRTCNEALPNDGAGYCECSDGTKGYMGCNERKLICKTACHRMLGTEDKERIQWRDVNQEQVQTTVREDDVTAKVSKLHRDLDSNSDGLDPLELQLLMIELGNPDITEAQAAELLEEIDEDENGLVELEELLDEIVITRKQKAKGRKRKKAKKAGKEDLRH